MNTTTINISTDLAIMITNITITSIKRNLINNINNTIKWNLMARGS